MIVKISDLDISFTVERAHEIVSLQFPQFAKVPPEILGRGWDNVCVVYPDLTVFRLPTRQVGGEIMATECSVLPKIAPFLSLPVPNFTYFGKPNGDYPWPFVGYPFLKGRTSEQFSWSKENRIRAASILGKFLRELHQIPVSHELTEVLPQDLIDRSSREANLRRIANYASQIQESYPERNRWVENLQEQATSFSKDIDVEPLLCIVHGDLYPRHILANEAKDVVGIIDWGDVHLGHPLVDLSIAYTLLDGGERDIFWESYGLPVSKGMRAMAKIKAINYALALYLYGRYSDDHNLLKTCDLISQRVFVK